MKTSYNEVVAANVKLHSILADKYNTEEPHFRPENIKAVSEKLNIILEGKTEPRILDLGCGTGFIINILRDRTCNIDGVDITPAMLKKVSLDGTAKIRLIESDTASFNGATDSYDLVTAYSFIHHLFNYTSTLENAFRMLKSGGALYIDLEPNFYYWQALKNLSRVQKYSPTIEREISQTIEKDEDIENRFGVPADVFNKAEYGKNINGGLKAEELKDQLMQIGFSDVTIQYNWFLGQGKMINDLGLSSCLTDRLRYGKICEENLRESLPLSLHLFKYFEILARK